MPLEGIRYRTIKPVQWEIGRKGSGYWLRVPPGFVFDVSVPLWLRWAFNPRCERFLKAACLHDYALDVLYWDRTTAAAAFNSGLTASGVGRIQRLIMTLAVIVWRWR